MTSPAIYYDSETYVIYFVIYYLIHVLLTVTVLGLVNAACQDLDRGACAVIQSKFPNMCSDPCIAVICSDTCNNCRMLTIIIITGLSNAPIFQIETLKSYVN